MMHHALCPTFQGGLSHTPLMLALRGYGTIQNGRDGGVLENIISKLICDDRVNLDSHGGDEVCLKHKST